MADFGGATELAVRTPDGRSLEVVVAGPGDGLPLIFHHGTPGGAAVHAPMASAAAARGLRLVVYGRPGYGSSTAQPGRVIADAAADVTAILDALGAPRFVTAGWSGGGPHALACGQLLPGRCLAVACLAGPAPYNAAGLDWMAGIADDNVAEFSAAAAGEPELTTMLAGVAPMLCEMASEELAAGLGDLASAADKDALHGEVADYLVRSFRAGLGNGIDGWRDETLRSSERGVSLRPLTAWPRRSRSGRGIRITWCRSLMASGWPGPSRRRARTCSPGPVTCRCPAARSRTSCSNWLARARANAQPRQAGRKRRADQTSSSAT